MANDVSQQVKGRVSVIRLRTWSLTIGIVVALVFYFLVQIGTKQSLSWVDFVFLTIVQLLTHFLYFPDGELYGAKNDKFTTNRDAYNTKATKINTEHNIGKLREFCKVDYELRKEEYLLTQCGALGITKDEYKLLQSKTQQEIKKLKSFSTFENFEKKEGERIIFFSKHKRKKLYNLLFKPFPIEMNKPELIMSALECDNIHSIRDESVAFKRRATIRKILMSVIIGGTFAYIGYTIRDGIGLAEITSIVMYLTSLFSTAVMSYSSGETCTKVYKNNFYLNLSNFIDALFEWIETNKVVTKEPLHTKPIIKKLEFKSQKKSE